MRIFLILSLIIRINVQVCQIYRIKFWILVNMIIVDISHEPVIKFNLTKLTFTLAIMMLELLCCGYNSVVGLAYLSAQQIGPKEESFVKCANNVRALMILGVIQFNLVIVCPLNDNQRKCNGLKPCFQRRIFTLMRITLVYRKAYRFPIVENCKRNRKSQFPPFKFQIFACWWELVALLVIESAVCHMLGPAIFR